jgi:hypothetical protein
MTHGLGVSRFGQPAPHLLSDPSIEVNQNVSGGR